MKNIDQDRELLRRRRPHIAMLSETCTTEDIDDVEIECEGYNCIRINSHSRYTGGCCIYVSKLLNFELIDCLTLTKESWMISVKVEKAKEECIFTVVYNSPNGSKSRCINFFEEWCENNLDLSKRNIICGDFNIDLMRKTYQANKLQYVIDYTGMKQAVNGPTRITDKSETKIDLVITNCDVEVEVMKEDKISDHATLNIRTSLFNTCERSKIFVNRVVGYSKDKLIDKLKECDWTNLSTKSVDDKAKILTERLKESMSQFIKKIEIKENESEKWYDEELKQQRIKRDSTYSEAILTSNRWKWNKHKFERNKYVNMLSNKKSDFIESQMEQARGDSKKTWRILKNLLKGRQNNEIKQVEINETKVTDSQEISEKINVFFVDSVREINNSIGAPNSDVHIRDQTSGKNCKFKFKMVS